VLHLGHSYDSQGIPASPAPADYPPSRLKDQLQRTRAPSPHPLHPAGAGSRRGREWRTGIVGQLGHGYVVLPFRGPGVVDRMAAANPARASVLPRRIGMT